jgi:molecular chaperone GrpE
VNPPDPTPLPPEEPAIDSEAVDGPELAPDAELVAHWKSRLRYDFERWLSTVDEVPLLDEPERETEEPPDLYAFFEQLAVLNTESRRANRRTAESLSQWSEAFARFESQLDRVRELAAQSLAARGPAEGLSRRHCLALVEILDRLQRIAVAFARTPTRPWLGGDGAWRRAWESQRQALAIATDHFETLLRKEGVARVEALGKPFDPHHMTAVAVEATRQHPPQTVIEETARGYLWNGELLRAAQVKLATPPPTT